MTRAQMNMSEFWLADCRAAPRIAKSVPMRVPRLRPILSPTQPARKRVSGRGTIADAPRVTIWSRTWLDAWSEGKSTRKLTTDKARPHGAKVIGGGEAALLGRVGDDVVVTYLGHGDEAGRGADGAVDALVVTCATRREQNGG